MFSTIYRFEVRQHLKKVFTWVFLFLMMAQGVYYMHHSGAFYSADRTFANAPAIVYTVLAGMGYLGFIVAGIFGSLVLGKDLEYKTASFLYTTRATENTFFAARYLGSLVVLLLLYGGYLLGIMLYNYLPIDNLGPVAWGAFLRGILLIFLPNVFIIYTLCFGISVLFRNPKLAYMVALLTLLLMIFGETTFDSNPQTVLLDPTAFSVLHSQLEHLSPAEKNSFSPDFAGLLLWNRVIWITLGMLALGLAWRRFSFRSFISRTEPVSKTNPDNHHPMVAVRTDLPTRKTRQHFSPASDWNKVFSLAWLEFKTTVRPLGFRIFLTLLLVMYVGYTAVWQQQYYSAAPTLPVTVEITSVTLPMAFYILMFLIVNTTELLFKNSSTGFWQIGDALPVPTWVSLLSKIGAMTGVAFLILVNFTLFGVGVQAAKGYYDFDWMVYGEDLFIRWLPKYVLYILLTVFVAGLTANRYATHWITILFLLFSLILHETDVIEQNRLNFMFSPGTKMNTDMNGNGLFTLAHGWYMLYWFSLAVSLCLVGLWLWQRGTLTPLGKRLAHLKKQVSPVTLVLFVGGLLGFGFCGQRIYQAVNVDNHFQTNEEARIEAALYEKTYSIYRYSPQPTISHFNLQLDFYPAERNVSYTTQLHVQNRTLLPMDTLHVEWMDFSALRSLSVNGKPLSLLRQDTTLRHALYRLPRPLLPNDSLIVTAVGTLQHTGYTNGDPQPELTFNGSFLPSGILPYFGYDPGRELKGNQYRPDYGLAKLTHRLPAPTDQRASQQLFASTQALRPDYTLTISTTDDQRIVAPGKLEKEWQQQGRRYYRFRSEQPTTFAFHLLSARYAVKKATDRIAGKPVAIELYYHPGHPYNTSHLLTTARQALDTLSRWLGPYPYTTLRIAERPRYDEELFAEDNVLVLPENHGWIADVRSPSDLDYLHFVVTRLIAQQFMQQANVSRTQGYPFITRSIPYYLALCQLEQTHGSEAVQHHLTKSRDQYLKGRAKETNEEPSLLQCDEEADYVFNEKGGAALYELSKTVGKPRLNRLIGQFLQQARLSPKPIPATVFYDQLRASVGNRALLTRLFEEK
ncbi:hypothetical protein [Siphonobacter sp. SORGH_AS_1065]|uniref:ABC transporter permease/M1 family aminopeptidase n=1 Tax=Siphonobacter sp. SORGH_AS_1065 TaxID=3041795 RepID=UPI0027826D5D|nr:hypothetical protein [Siphonobacter sp. SORGH_AS_1065]MDQ1087161.1 ABC-2 type transport system permease protein [Siphonobacter sp. SORGH_AS_1065]